MCVPARDEEDRLPTLLDALAAQDVEGPVRVVVALNNTRDRSRSVAEAAGARHGGRLVLKLDERSYPPELAHAGSARRRALALGAAWLGHRPTGVLLGTDADARPPRDWVRANLAAIAAGADVIGGRLVIDEAEPLTDEARAIRALWHAYWVKVRAIEDALDPAPHDPPPRHGDHTGASLAITVEAHAAAGGTPRVRTGEDRALVAAAVSAGFRLRHPMSVWTRVSPRLDGRADGGMAQAMRELTTAAAARSRPLAPSLDQWRARARWRREVRRRLGLEALAAAEAALPPMPHDTPLDAVEAAEAVL